MNLSKHSMVKFPLLPTLLLVAVGQSDAAVSPPEARATAADVLLVSFFRGNGQAGVFLAASEDGLHFKALNNDQPVMKPAPWVGQNLTRDPSVAFHDGTFRAVWTTSWKGACFAYAESKDLVTWSVPVRVEPFDGPQPDNIWAPEICWDPLAKNHLILWSSRMGPQSSQIFMTRTVDGKTFSRAQPCLKRDFGIIDAFLLRDEAARRWVMIYKNEEAEPKGGKNLRAATAPLDFSKPWTDLLGQPVIGPGTALAADTMTEGPTLLRMGAEYFLYWDSPLRGKKSGAPKPDAAGKQVAADSFGMASSTDLKTWKDRTAELQLPTNVRHGTVFRAPRAAVGWLKQSDPDKQP